jgi:adenosine deaminase
MVTLPTDDLRALPKVELHRHLEGSIRLQTVIDLHRQAGLELPTRDPQEFARVAQVRVPFASLDEALQAFGFAQRSFTNYDAVRRIARENVEDLARDGVVAGELRWSPAFMCQAAGLDWDGALDAIEWGFEDARSGGADVAVGQICIFSRDFGMESAARTVAFALKNRERFVGFDVAGPEVDYPPLLYVDVLRPLQEAGLPITLHYGESGPPAYPREAVEMYGVSRLGHGLSAAWDQEVTALIANRGVTLEMCPWSNWLTQGVREVEDHPIRDLLRRGVRATLNSDDPGMFGTDLTYEYELARDTLGFTAEDFAAVNRNALEASFLPESVLADVRRRRFPWVDDEDASPG